VADALDDLPRRPLQVRAMRQVEVGMRFAVEDAERACVLERPYDQRSGGVESDAWVADDEGVILYGLSIPGICDDDGQVSGDVVAEKLEVQTKPEAAPLQAEVRAIPCKHAHAVTHLQYHDAASHRVAFGQFGKVDVEVEIA